jgi:hypothetical protein
MNSDNKAEKTWTQGQVRETFVRGREQHADFPGINNSRAEFESWLAEHDAEVLAGARREALDPYPYLDDNGYRWAVGGGSGAKRTYKPRDIFSIINDAKAEARREALKEAAAAVKARPFLTLYLSGSPDIDWQVPDGWYPSIAEAAAGRINALLEGVTDEQ